MTSRDYDPGYEISDSSGWISHVGFRSVNSQPAPVKGLTRYKNDDAMVQGYALLWNKVVKNPLSGKYMAIRPHAFRLHDGTKKYFQLDHDDSIQVASTSDYLVLHSDDVGLAFRLRIGPSVLARETRELVRTSSKQAMSAAFAATDYETQVIEGLPITVVTKAVLKEVSLVTAGACGPAFATLVDGADATTLADHCKSQRVTSDLHAAAMMRALRNLQ